MQSDNHSRIRVMRIIARMNIGGPAVQVSGLMRGLNESEFDQRLYTGFCGSDEADYLDTVATDVKAIRIEGLGRRISIRADVKAFVNLVKEIRRFKPQVIHTHTAKAGFLGRIASVVSFQDSVRVHTFHGHLLNGYFGKFKRLIIVISEITLAIFTDQLLAVGNKVRMDLLSVGVGSRSNFGLMPPGLSVGALPTRIDSCQSLGLSASRLRCAYIGRVTQIKRPDRFLDVVSEIKKRRIDIEFIVAGGGDLLHSLQNRVINENLPVTILGWQSDIEKVLSVADIVLLTSDNEGMPLSLIQAGMSAIPVVTTNVGSAAEIVLDGVTGFVTSIDIIELADALEMLAKSSELRTKLGSAAQVFTKEYFGVQRLVNDHENLYKKLLFSRAKS